MLRIGKRLLLVALALLAFGTAAQAKTELTMYYPVAVGGPLTSVVDGMIQDFERHNPDVKVNAIYAGNYNDARVKALPRSRAASPRSFPCSSPLTCMNLWNWTPSCLLTTWWKTMKSGSGCKASTPP